MSRRSSGLIGVWAEAQRQQQRQQEARRRASMQQQRQREREQRAQERDAARATREQQAAYRQSREADARLRTQELDARVDALTGLLAAGCAAQPFTTGSLRRTQESIEPFAPGALAQPVAMPDPARYQAQGGWTANRRDRAQQEAQAAYQRDWDAAQLAETERRRRLAEYRDRYDAWAAARLAEVQGLDEGVDELVAGLRAADPGAVVEYFSAALYAAAIWPEGFPRRLSCSYDRGAKQLVLDWELPAFDVVPAAKSVRYVASSDEEREAARPAAQRRALYRDTLAQSVLLVVRDLFAADEYGVLESVALNGFVDDVDPATGRRAEIFLATVMVERTALAALNLAQVSAVDCLVDALHGQLSSRPDQRAAVRPLRRPGELGAGVVSHGSDEDEPDLFVMDPIEFEVLVAELFRARGMRAVTTQRSNDGGVDVEALDADPISGGRIIVQVKRYRNTVPPTAVRDLYGTVQGAGANKGVLVTTSGFGPGSYAFAQGKPLTLVSGAELVDLLHECGLRGRLGERGERAPSSERTPTLVDTPLAPAASEPEDDFNVLGMTWAGAVALDVCVLVCEGNRVLDDDHFVFFNNREVPGGSVRMVPGAVEDRAAVRVAFDALPPRADRLVLVASVDPEVNPDADLSGFTDAGILLRDATGAELDRLPVSDGRAGETALVLGSFRRRPGDDWDFVLGGRGYTGGLEALIGDFGIEVE
ncbi:restriction endonuclease [Streptomyces sp. NPDC048696]|uniref:restriction endonuclease n=1 Tax=Streptomyces sp. NPDC048696 TaxID=3365585 RepID=UPI0037169FED